MKSYSEMAKLQTFEERFSYLKLDGTVGMFTFNGHRKLNQLLYQCEEWQSVRQRVIIRDEGCNLGILDRPIYGKIMIHHMNPITIEDVMNKTPVIFDMENLITSDMQTHNAIHYGNELSLPIYSFVERRPGDTCLWRK